MTKQKIGAQPKSNHDFKNWWSGEPGLDR